MAVKQFREKSRSAESKAQHIFPRSVIKLIAVATLVEPPVCDTHICRAVTQHPKVALPSILSLDLGQVCLDLLGLTRLRHGNQQAIVGSQERGTEREEQRWKWGWSQDDCEGMETDKGRKVGGESGSEWRKDRRMSSARQSQW